MAPGNEIFSSEVKRFRMAFQFRLQAVLKLRQHERDLHQQSVAAARACHAQRFAERDILAESRASVLNELRSMNEGDSWSVDQVIDRQRHAEQLGRDLTNAEAAIMEAGNHLEVCLKRLIAADQSVRGLERLAERHFAEYQLSQARIAAQEFDDIAMSHCHASN